MPGRQAKVSGRFPPSTAVPPACRWCAADGAPDWHAGASNARRSRTTPADGRGGKAKRRGSNDPTSADHKLGRSRPLRRRRRSASQLGTSKGSGPAIDGDFVKETALLRELGEGGTRQQRDLVRSMVPPDGRRRPERLNEVPERTELDDEDFAPRHRRRGRDPARPACRQSSEIDKLSKLLERFEYGRVPSPTRRRRCSPEGSLRPDAPRRLPKCHESPAV